MVKSKYPTRVNGKQTKEYTLWCNMRSRCLVGGAYQRKHPSYVGVSHHPEFAKFTGFIEWAMNQIGFGLDDFALDKDILVPGNRVYGPNTCVFVPSQLNGMLTHQRDMNGYPPGVSIKSHTNKFVAQIKRDGVVTTLGYFDNPNDAFLLYKSTKEAEIKRQAHLYKDVIDPRVFQALLAYEVN